MQSNPKTVTIFLIILGFVFAFSPIIAINNSFLTRNNSEFSEISDNEGTDQMDPYGMEGLATSSIPALLVWNYTTPSNVRNVAISSNGQYIAAGSYDWNLYFFERDNSTPLWSSNVGETMDAVAISSDGQYVVVGTGTMGEKVYLFEKNNSTPLWSYDTGGRVASAAISSDGQYIAVGTGRFDDSVLLFEKNSSTPLWRYNTGSYVASVAISSNGNYIVAGSHNDKLYFFERNSSTPIWTYTTPDWAQSVSISSDGNYIVVGTANGVNPLHGIHVFEKSNSTPLWSYTTGHPIWSVAISSDAQYIAFGTAYTGNQVYLFERNNSTPLWSFDAGDSVSSVALSSDGQYIVAGSYDNKVYLFNKNSSTPLFDSVTGSNVASVGISSDGTYFVAAGNDNNVYLFKIAFLPHIAINLPILNQIYGSNAPEFNITTYILSPINTTWYTIDGGITNITIYSNQGSLNQVAWDNISHGSASLNFYANDSFGRIGYSTIVIYKDLNAPTTSLEYTAYNPPNQVTGSTNFTLIAADDGAGVSTTEYKINDGSWTTYTGTFTLSGFDPGIYTIAYRSIDLVGNIESEQFLNVELVIPPPDLSFLLYIIIIGAVIATIGILYFKVIRPRTAESRKLKKKNRLEQKRLKRERLEQMRRDREMDFQMQAGRVSMESVDTKREEILRFKYCPECGNPLKFEYVNFCYNCGKRLRPAKS